MITLLVSPQSFAGAELRIEGDAYRHLFRARRLAAGERLRLVNGEGGARWGDIVEVGRAAATVRPAEPADPQEPLARVELFVPTLRPERAAWLVEKATELGAAAITFVHSERAPRDLGAGALARLRRIAAAAVEQCHRACCPRLGGPLALVDLPRPSAVGSLAGAAAAHWLLDPRGEVSRGLVPAAPGDTAGVLIGPEGGWAPAESAALEAAGWQAVSLGPRILRVETAAVAAAALLLLPPAQ